MPQKSTITKASPKTVTSIADYLELVDLGVLWAAPSGATFRVRDVSIADRAFIGQLPTNLQTVVDQMIDRAEALRNTDDEQDAIEELSDALGGGERRPSLMLANAYAIAAHMCCLAFIEPQVVMTPQEITDPAVQMWVGKLRDEDRQAFLQHVFGADQAEAAKLATFSDGAERAS